MPEHETIDLSKVKRSERLAFFEGLGIANAGEWQATPALRFQNGVLQQLFFKAADPDLLQWRPVPSVLTEDAITPSCGCVFCDLALEPVVINGRKLHDKDGTLVPCTKPKEE